MATLRHKYLLGLILFFAVVLQGLTPFLHAHTGASSKFGLHMHVVSAGIEAVATPQNQMRLISADTSESPEVGVPASRENEAFAFDLPDVLALVFLVIPLVILFSYLSLLKFEYVLFFKKIHAQNSLPPALAPPYSL
jgi:ABC-type Na+ efflux pump permease subunit